MQSDRRRPTAAQLACGAVLFVAVLAGCNGKAPASITTSKRTTPTVSAPPTFFYQKADVTPSPRTVSNMTVTRPGSPFRTGPFQRLSDIEQATSEWVHWYNTARLMHRLGRRPPAEREADYYARTSHDQQVAHT